MNSRQITNSISNIRRKSWKQTWNPSNLCMRKHI